MSTTTFSSHPDLTPARNPWAAWDALLEATAETGFMQSSWWADFRVDAGYGHFGVVLRNRGAIVGGALVLTYPFAPGHLFYYVPEGPVLPAQPADTAEVYAAILDGIDERRRAESGTVSHLRIEPRWERLPDFVRGFQPVPAFHDGIMEPRDTLCIDLHASESAILAQMKPKGRYNIGVARRHGIAVREDSSRRGLSDFLRIYRATTLRQGLIPKPPDYFEALMDQLTARDCGAMHFAEHRGTRIAAALVVTFGSRATYFYGGSLETHRETMAPYLLHYEIMCRAREMGCAWYDLWGVSPPGPPDGHPWDGISTFKRKFGGTEVGLVPTLDFVYDPDAYDRYSTR